MACLVLSANGTNCDGESPLFSSLLGVKRVAIGGMFGAKQSGVYVSVAPPAPLFKKIKKIKNKKGPHVITGARGACKRV